MINKIINAMEYIDKVIKEIDTNKKETDKIKYIYDNYKIENLGCPHIAPKSLPKGSCAVYIFIYNKEILKIGKVNEKSNARFCTQHYGFNARSTLAKSICKDKEFIDKGINEANVKEWMLNNLQRVNIIINSNKAAINLIESMLHYIFLPRYEGDI